MKRENRTTAEGQEREAAGSPAHHRGDRVPYYVRGLALGVPVYLIGIHFWSWVFTLPVYLNGRADLRQLYAAGYMVRAGYAHQLYDYNAQFHFQNMLVSPGEVPLPFIRPAYEALLFAPLSLLHFRAAYFTFLAVNLGLLAMCYRMLRPFMNYLAAIYRWLPAALFLAFLPVGVTLLQGQDSILLLTLLTAGMVRLHRQRNLAAGALVGLGLFKFQIVIPIALLFLVWRGWRFLAGFGLTAVVTAATSLWLAGLAQSKIYASSLVSMGAGAAAQRADELWYPVPVYLMANLHGLADELLSGRLSPGSILTVTLMLSGSAWLWVAWASPRKAGREALILAIPTAALVSYYLLVHDLTILLLPLLASLDRYLQAERSGSVRERLVARAAALMFVAPVCISYFPQHFYLVAVPLALFLFALMQNRGDSREEALPSA